MTRCIQFKDESVGVLKMILKENCILYKYCTKPQEMDDSEKK